MKKLYLTPAILIFSLFLFQSCSKESKSPVIPPASPSVINATITPNQTYLFNISSAGNVNIEKQASHFKVSKTGTDEKNGQLVYQYIPAQDYSGQDEVVLSSKVIVYSGGSTSGCSSSHVNDNTPATGYTTTYTTIRFTVAN